jgi:hypothetical protein
MAPLDAETSGDVIITDEWLRHNGDVAWEEFAPDAYWQHNYSSLREDDRAILLRVGAFLSHHYRTHPHRPGAVGLDVGSGANLYPALCMLPWVDGIVLTDHSPSNVEWLSNSLQEATPDQHPDDTWAWQPFWQTLSAFPGYDRDQDTRALLTQRCKVEQRDVFHLGENSRYDIGTMFFVAESLTSFETEFEEATQHFLQALKPGAPFAAAFMDKSLGYVVGEKSYPAVREVDSERVSVTLEQAGARAEVTKIPVPGNDPLRDGYDGMIVAVGTTA